MKNINWFRVFLYLFALLVLFVLGAVVYFKIKLLLFVHSL